MWRLRQAKPFPPPFIRLAQALPVLGARLDPLLARGGVDRMAREALPVKLAYELTLAFLAKVRLVNGFG